MRLGSRVLIDDGRVREYRDSDFNDRDAAVNITTFQSYGENVRVMGDCCSMRLRTTLDIVTFIPLKRSCEADVEAIELDMFALLAPMLGSELQLDSLRTTPHQLDTECPVTARIASFNANLDFNPAKPPTQETQAHG